MAGNALERAVVEAARALVAEQRQETYLECRLELAVGAYEAWLATQDPQILELGWHEVAEGDHVRSAKNGRYYPVTSVLKIRGGKWELTLAGVPNKITRPNAAEPTATVRRGPTGSAVDTLLHVFSSGGA